MTVELTRQLLEHYLRATGWTQVGEEWTSPSRLWFVWQPGRPIRLALKAVAKVERVTSADEECVFNQNDLAFRLGLCAAAERLIAAARTSFMDRSYAVTCGVQAHDLLRAAGISPDAWEAARKQETP